MKGPSVAPPWGSGGAARKAGGVGVLSLTIKVYVAVPVEVDVLQDLVHLLGFQLLPQQRRDGLPHLSAADLPVAVHVELRCPRSGARGSPFSTHPTTLLLRPWASCGHQPLQACSPPRHRHCPTMVTITSWSSHGHHPLHAHGHPHCHHPTMINMPPRSPSPPGLWLVG